jgi:hypothetical protein
MISDGQPHQGLRAGLADLLTLTGTQKVAVITPVTDLPAITAANTSVDGTTQTANVGDTNAGPPLGTGGTVGVGGLTLGTVARPEVEISGSSGTNNNGLLIQAADAFVTGLAIHGFGNANGEAGVTVEGGSTARIRAQRAGIKATFRRSRLTAQRNQAASTAPAAATARCRTT